ncbi:MAG TPA: class I SAM-dependent methyltransferase [Aggregatilineales bacterium]|nr:class I SAM-dependent methyltransferase [Aggregatilineales bacterium]
MSEPSASSESYAKSARFYDAIYAAQGKDYAREAQQIHELIRQHKKSDGNTLLDVACGTGKHLQFLKKDYMAEGLDIDAEMIKAARAQQPEITFQQADMLDFRLDRHFDAIICLFSAIGYAKTVANLARAMQTMAQHLKPGGVLIVEPWLLPDGFTAGLVFSTTVDQPDLKITRMNLTRRESDLSFLDYHYLVGTPQRIEYFTEHHELGLFTDEEYLAAFAQAGLATTFDAQGLTGRGLYIGVKKIL